MPWRLRESEEEDVRSAVKKAMDPIKERRNITKEEANAVAKYAYEQTCDAMERDRQDRVGSKERDDIDRRIERKLEEVLANRGPPRGRDERGREDSRRDDRGRDEHRDRSRDDRHQSSYGSGNGGYQNGGHGNGNGHGNVHGNGHSNGRGNGNGGGGSFGGNGGGFGGGGNGGGFGGGGAPAVGDKRGRDEQRGGERAGQQKTFPVVTNFVQLRAEPCLCVEHYDVTFVPEIALRESRVAILRDMPIMGLLSAPNPNGVDNGWCYDGSKIMYFTSPPCLATDGAGGWVQTAGQDGGKPSFEYTAFEGTARAVKLALAYTKTLDFAEFPANQSREHMAALDIALKQHPSTIFKGVGDAFYDERKERAWATARALGSSGEYEMHMGFRQSVQLTKQGGMMLLDRAATVFKVAGPLLKLFQTKMKKAPEQLRLEDCKYANRSLKQAKGATAYKITCSHTFNSGRTYKLRSIDDVAASESMFQPDREEGGPEMSVADYFEKKLGKKLKYPHLPCVNVGPARDPRKTRLPLELCSFAPFQPAGDAAQEMQSESIKLACQVPIVKMKAVNEILDDVVREQRSGRDKTVPAFQITLAPQLFQTRAKQLPSPPLSYRNRQGAEHIVQPNTFKGEWNMRGTGGGGDLSFMQPGKSQAWAIVAFDKIWKRENVDKFAQMMERLARERGMQLGKRSPGYIDGTHLSRSHHGADIEDFLDSKIKRESHELGAPVGLVICIIGDSLGVNAKVLYPAIKRWSHCASGIPTQCVQVGKALAKQLEKPQYYAGVLLKMNLKLGGHNLYARQGLSLSRDKPTIVFGVDVNHAKPGSSKPSFAALVATMDKECASYHTIVNAQSSRQEQCDIKGKVRQCLRRYQQINETPPQRIIFYRDGIANNMFDKEAASEIKDIRLAAKEEGGEAYHPELIYIVVQQRTRMRVAKLEGGNIPGGTAGNVPPGTVMDEDVVSPTVTKDADGNSSTCPNFYMVSQFGLQGTCRPTHYHVLCNDCAAPGEEEKMLPDIEKYTFDLCHLYARAVKIVSRPAPVYYAHRAAFLAQYYESNYKDMGDQWETGSTASTTSGGGSSQQSDVPDIHLEKRTADTVYFA